MATFIRRHPLLAYYVLTFALSWGGFLLVVGPSSLVNSNWQVEGNILSAVMVMLAGPSIAGLLLTGLIEGRAGYRDLLLRLGRWRVGIRWYALAIVPAPIVSAGVLFALSITSPLLIADNRAAVVFGGLGAAVTTILEEIGWTGFVVPRLRRRHGVPMTGLIVGVLWGLWHFLQQVFVSGTYAGGIQLPVFLMLSLFAAVASLTAYRVLMVWLYDRPRQPARDDADAWNADGELDLLVHAHCHRRSVPGRCVARGGRDVASRRRGGRRRRLAEVWRHRGPSAGQMAASS